MKLVRGLTIESAIPLDVTFIADVSEKSHRKLDELFGGKDTNYYIMGERFIDSRQEYYVILVEDMQSKQHQVFFKVNMVK